MYNSIQSIHFMSMFLCKLKPTQDVGLQLNIQSQHIHMCSSFVYAGKTYPGNIILIIEWMQCYMQCKVLLNAQHWILIIKNALVYIQHLKSITLFVYHFFVKVI